MPETIDDVTQTLLDDVDSTTNLESRSTAVKNLKTFAEAKKLLEPDPTPDPEPSGFKGFLDRHAGDLIKVGGTLVVVGFIAFTEAKGDVIFRSKAAKFI